MRKLEHENVVQLKEVIDDKKSNNLYMVQEFMVHGPIMTEAEYNKPLDVDVARVYFRCVASVCSVHGASLRTSSR